MQFRYNEQRNFRPTCSLYRGLTPSVIYQIEEIFIDFQISAFIFFLLLSNLLQHTFKNVKHATNKKYFCAHRADSISYRDLLSFFFFSRNSKL
ncbi:hypothetical protein BpHYR1_047546 [Brachionus plicatilis]|uniref:Uncharacterized protein n=1 Tax=Brachionus plicatilis TaxID=10195 RepID=A0A3M7Q6G3_BRAPC|nr:hypothetical protein BpHYR1_047546 [Brachionus plicatilis]